MSGWNIKNPYSFDPRENNAKDNLLMHLLEIRGIIGKKEISGFLNPDLDSVTLRSLKVDENQAKKAAERIREGIRKKEKMVVYTDYDADGICSGAIIWETLYSLRADIMPFVPDRLIEGYGLSKKGIDRIRMEHNPSLIITVDHGITKTSEIEYARRLGIDVIVIDHHLAPSVLPPAVSVVHSTIPCATGLSWVFANYLKGEVLEKFLDLVAVATVADMVPLKGPNRVLVKFGLEKINRTRRPGLLELIKGAGLKKGSINEHSLSHVLAPRLNASGRLTHAMDSLRLLCTRDHDRAAKLAEELNSVNRNRQTLTRESTVLAVSQVAGTERIIFASDSSFHQGIIGLIAGKLVESYARPAIVVSVGEEYCKASVRSVRGINIVEFLSLTKELLVDLGGHPMAAGFTVRRDNLEELKKRIVALSANLETKQGGNDLDIDMEINPEFLDTGVCDQVMRLAPFGQGNPEPVFASFGLEVVDSRLVGSMKNHLKLTLQSPAGPGKYLSAIGFNMAGNFPLAASGNRIDIAYSIEKDEWNGGDKLNLKMKDVRLTS